MVSAVLKNSNFKKLIWAIIIVGIALRLAQYFYNRSLFIDEAALSLNLINRSFAGLFQPLDYDQGAPIGFLMVQKFLITLFGSSELILRLFPVAAGLIAILLFYLLIKDRFTSDILLIAILLFIVSNRLIYYSSVVKQYSPDVAVALALYLISCKYHSNSKTDLSSVIFFGAIGAIAVWLSHPAVFVLAGAGTVIGIQALIKKDWISLARISLVYLMWMISFLLLYFVSLRGLTQNECLINFWEEHFIPYPLAIKSSLKWFLSEFTSYIKYSLGFNLGDFIGIPVFKAGEFMPGLSDLSGFRYIGVIFIALLAFASAITATICFLLGGYSLFRKNSTLLFILISPALFTLIASIFRKYPFGSRFLMFLIPIAYILIPVGMEFISRKFQTHYKAIFIVLAIVLLAYPSILAGYHLIRPRTVEEIKPILNYLEENKHENDVIYIYYGAYRACLYYEDRFSFGELEIVSGSEQRNHIENYIPELDKLMGNKRVWILFSHVYDWVELDEEEYFIEHLDEIGTRTESYEAPGASIYLYNLND